jgi:hypothetical protein
MFYRKVKKFCFVMNFFIWIVIKNYWCDVKSVKKLKCFLFDFFERSEMGIEIVWFGYQTGPIYDVTFTNIILTRNKKVWGKVMLWTYDPMLFQREYLPTWSQFVPYGPYLPHQ